MTRSVAIIDYGMGNLFSIQQACRTVGLTSLITSNPDEVRLADGVILPGIGAMPDAVKALQASGMDNALRQVADAGKPLFGVCLGMQLLMAEGTEFGRHKGLGILPGTVQKFDHPMDGETALKVPAIGWNAIEPAAEAAGSRPWSGTLLEDIAPGSSFYFVHSYHVVPERPEDAVAVSRYGQITYVSAVTRGSVFGCQFHPERSGPQGLAMYRAFARRLQS